MPRQFELHELRGQDLREYRITATGRLTSATDAIVALCAALLLIVCDSSGASIALALAVAYLLHRAVQCCNFVRHETLTVIQEFGAQKTTTYATGKKEYRFIAKHKINECVINEAVLGCSVVFYIAFIVAGQQEMELAFDHFTPSLHQITPVFEGVRAVLFGEPEHLPPPAASRRSS